MQHRGVSLLEVLFSLLVLSAGVVGMGKLHRQLQGHADMARQRSEAVRLAHDEIEVAGVVRGAVHAAAVGPHLLVREMGGDEPPQLLHLLGSKREREVSHVFVGGFRRGRGRRAENR